MQGRGELQLAVLVETDAPRGLRAHRRQAAGRDAEVDGKLHEPVERLAIDVPEEYVGVVTQLLALRKGRLEQMVNHGTGWVRLEYLVPARGLIGFRTEFLTETRGTGHPPPRLRAATSSGSASSGRARTAASSPTAAGQRPGTR